MLVVNCKLYQSRLNQSTIQVKQSTIQVNQSTIQVKQDTIHTATIQGTNNATLLLAILLAIGVNTNTSNHLINVSTGHIHTATIPWTINATTWAWSRKISVSIRTLAINWSMSLTEHDPHGYNPVNYQRHNLGGISLAYGVNTDTSNQLINTNTQGTIPIRIFQRNQINLHCNQSSVLIITNFI